MRVLIYPLYGFRFLGGESNFLFFYNLVRRWKEDGRRFYAYFVVPENYEGELPEDVSDVVHWLRFPFEAYMISKSFVSGEIGELFPQMKTGFAVDAVINATAQRTLNFLRIFKDYWNDYPIVPVISFEELIGVYDVTTQYSGDEISLVLTLISCAMAPTIYDSRREFEVVLRFAREYFKGSLIQRIIDNAHVINSGVPIDLIDRVTAGIQKNDRFTVFFGGRLNSIKRAESVLEVFRRLSLICDDCEFLVTTPTADIPHSAFEVLRKIRNLTLVRRASYDVFWKNAKRAHAFISLSTTEGFSIGIAEQFYLGLVGVIPDASWTRGMFPGLLDDYKYKHDYDLGKIVAMLLDIKENYDEAVKQAKRFADYVAENHNIANWADSIWNLIKGEVKKAGASFKFSKNVEETIVRALSYYKVGDVFSFDEFVQLLDKMTSIGKIFSNRTTVSSFRLYRWLMDSGCVEDRYNSPFPEFVKIKDYDGYGSQENKD